MNKNVCLSLLSAVMLSVGFAGAMENTENVELSNELKEKLKNQAEKLIVNNALSPRSKNIAEIQVRNMLFVKPLKEKSELDLIAEKLKKQFMLVHFTLLQTNKIKAFNVTNLEKAKQYMNSTGFETINIQLFKDLLTSPIVQRQSINIIHPSTLEIKKSFTRTIHPVKNAINTFVNSNVVKDQQNLIKDTVNNEVHIADDSKTVPVKLRANQKTRQSNKLGQVYAQLYKKLVQNNKAPLMTKMQLKLVLEYMKSNEFVEKVIKHIHTKCNVLQYDLRPNTRNVNYYEESSDHSSDEE